MFDVDIKLLFKLISVVSLTVTNLFGNDLTGDYECVKYDGTKHKNNWHYVEISSQISGSLVWTNAARVSWTLTPTDDPYIYDVGKDCPYYKTGYTKATFIRDQSGEIAGVLGPWGEEYKFSLENSGE